MFVFFFALCTGCGRKRAEARSAELESKTQFNATVGTQDEFYHPIISVERFKKKMLSP